MELNQMKYFIAVADCRSLTKAAQQLYISQPSLSRSIATIEKEAGTQLLDRSSRPFTLTFAGQRYYETAKQILQLEDNLSRQFRDISDGRSGRITIGFSSQRASYTLPAVLPAFRERFPGVEVRTIEDDSAHLEQALLRGQADLLIIPNQTSLLENELIDTEILGAEEFVLVCGEGVLTSAQCLDGYTHTVDFAKLKDYPFILLKQGHGSRRMTDRLFAPYSFTPKVEFECESNAVALHLVAAKVGLAMMPKKVVEAHRGCVSVNTFSLADPPVCWDVLAAFRKGYYQTKAEQYLLELLRQFYQLRK